jgi:hypothetical protein
VRKSILLLSVLCCVLLSGCAKSNQQTAYTGPPLNDIEYAKEVFRLLAEGDKSVKVMVDWEHLKMLQIDAGAIYSKISGETARDKYLDGFIEGYSKSFKDSGGRVENLSNWREQSRDASNTVVVADTQAGQRLLITVAHINGQQKVSTIDLK